MVATATLAGNEGSSEWPSAVAVARTGKRRPRRNSASSVVTADTPVAPEITAACSALRWSRMVAS
jgi:hypothetical protein